MVLLLLLTLTTLTAGEDYTIQTHTTNCLSCRTNDIQLTATIVGEDLREATTPYVLDSAGDDFRKGRTDTFPYSGLDAVGPITCIVLNAAGNDRWKFDWVQVKSASYPDYVRFENTEGVWMSSDTGEGYDTLRLCLSECDEDLPITTEYWELEEVVYEVAAEELMLYAPQNVGEQYINNEAGSTDQSTSFTVDESITETASYTHTAGVSVSVGTTFSCGIPAIVDGEVSTEVTASYEFEYGTEYSTTKTVSARYNCVAPAGRTVTCTALLLTGRLEVPYTQYWRHKRLDCVRESTGVFEEVAATSLRMEIEEENVFADGF